MYLIELLAEAVQQERLREAEASRLVRLGEGGGEPDGYAPARRLPRAGKPMLLWARLRGLRQVEVPCENCS